MSRHPLALAAALLLPLAACGDVGDAPEAVTTDVVATDGASTADALTFTGTAWPLVASDSTVTWIGAKLTGNHLGGFGDVTGSLYVDGSQVTGADVLIDATSITSDSDRLTGHLQSADFFDVATYPEARFQTTDLRAVTAADSLGDDSPATHLVTGQLTLRGQTRTVTFPATVTLDAGRATVQAAFLINRSEWGLTYPGAPDDLINEKVRIALNATATSTAAQDPTQTAAP